MLTVDLAIVGSGFAGSILAMIARRLGYRVALVERGRHPRFAIGESSSPLAGILLEQLAARYDLPCLVPLASFGAWGRAYPHLTCGLKRGFTYYAHEAGRAFHGAADRSTQLLVAASPNDDVADTHWLRADVDAFLAAEAVAAGADYLDETVLDGLAWQPDGGVELSGSRGGRAVTIRACVCVDATGPRGFVSRALSIDDAGFEGFPRTQALFSHFTGVARCGDMPDYTAGSGDGPAPYPADDAALHHVFDGGWMWVLRFGNGVTSAGVAVTADLARELRLADGAPAWDRLLARYPSIAAQFAEARPVRPFTWMPAVSYRASQVTGPGWALLPSAAAFIDPLFSTGFPLTLLGIERLARGLEAGLDGLAAGDGAYAAATSAEARHTAAFVAGCYAAFSRFEDFASYSMFYFAAASYAEMARRLASPLRPSRFLCADRPLLADALLSLSPARPASPRGAALADAVAAAVAGINIAGLCDPVKRHWYGVDPEDTVRAAARLGVTPQAVRTAIGGPGLAGIWGA